MSVYAGPADWWTDGTDAGRNHVATKGIVQTGLVLNLDAGVSASYPGTGNTWIDLSGNGNDGTLTNGPTFSSSNGGNIVTDGQDDYIQTPYIMPVSDFTVSCVFKLTQQAFWAGMWACETWNTSNGYLAYFTSATQLNFGRGGGSGFSTDTVTNISDFNHYAFTLNSSGTGIIYINGTQRSTGTIFLSSSIVNAIALATRYGNDGTGRNDRKASSVATFSIYNRVLSSAEIAQNFNALRSRYGL